MIIFQRNSPIKLSAMLMEKKSANMELLMMQRFLVFSDGKQLLLKDLKNLCATLAALQSGYYIYQCPITVLASFN